MAGTMSEADLVEDLKASLFDSAATFAADDDAPFQRFLQQALPDMGLKRPITRLGSLTLTAGVPRFAIAEQDFASLKTDIWREPSKLPKPWEDCYPGPLPRVSAQRDGAAWYIALDPAPSAAHLAVLGSTFKFYYFARHVVAAEEGGTTVAVEDRGLLLLRAQAEAMLAMALRNAAKPVSLRDPLSGVARNSTPAALHQQLLRLFWECR